MDQLLLNKKKEIIQHYLHHHVLLPKSNLDEIQEPTTAELILTHLRQNSNNKIFFDTFPTPQHILKHPHFTPNPTTIQRRQDVHIKFSYEDAPRKREVQDFVAYYNARFVALEALLRTR